MAFPKPTDEDRRWFEQLLPPVPGVEPRPMFGNLGGFVNGNMFMVLVGPELAVRLEPEARAELVAIEGAAPFHVSGRLLREYISIPQAWRDDLAAAEEWVGEALDFVATLPPKQPKPTDRRFRKQPD